MAHWAEVTIHGQKGAVEIVTSLCSELRDNVLPRPAGGKCKSGEEGERGGATWGEERLGTFQEAQKGSKRRS